MKYRAEIDGLRAVAVLPVMLFHAGFSTLSGGFVGVDIFFVISGYLITSILLKEMTSGDFSFINFYERRARRILPALYFLLLTTVSVGYFILIPEDYVNFAKSLIGVVLFVSNVVFWLQTNYFSPSSEYIPLLHTWSLAIEEQYYLFFPILLIFAHKLVPRKLFWLLGSIFVCSLLLADWGAVNKPSASYYLLPTRLWELLIGSIIAAYEFNSRSPLNEVMKKQQNLISSIGAGMVVLSFFLINKSTPFPGLWALLPTCGAAMIILFAHKGTFVFTILNNKFLVAVGLVSYSAYLWHQPVYAFIRLHSKPSALVMSVAFLFSLFMAFISWKYIEGPFRNRLKFSRKEVFTISGASSVFLIALGSAIIHNDGYEERFNLPETLNDSFELASRQNGWCFYSVDSVSALLVGKEGLDCVIGDKTASKKGILFGDSYAGMYEPFWDVISSEMNMKIEAITTNWCYPSASDKFWWPHETRAYEQCIYNRKYLTDELPDNDFIVFSAVWTHLPKENFNDTISFISDVAAKRSRKVILMAEPPRLTRTSVLRAVYGDAQLVSENDSIAINSNEKLQKLAKEHENIFFVSRSELFTKSKGDDEALSESGLPYSLDGGHISIYGSLEAADNYMTNGGYTRLKEFMAE